MKKYIKPEMEVVMLKAHATLLAGSGIDAINNDFSDEPQLAPGFTMEDIIFEGTGMP